MPDIIPSPPPLYTGNSSKGVALAVESMKRHMTDEGWQIMAGLEHAGYTLCGHNLGKSETYVPIIVGRTDPGIVVVQDKREWDVAPTNFRDKEARFTEVEYLRTRPDIFKLTIVKDAQHNPEYHQQSADEIGCHAWIVYYDPDTVCSLAPYVRRQHIVRTYHSLNPAVVPEFRHKRHHGCLLSGAVSNAYPLRKRLFKEYDKLPDTHKLRHPGYHMNGCQTAEFMQILSQYRAAICTASRYGYALRKIIEATACGCVVVTDLPEHEVMPEIDENLVRVSPEASTKDIAALLEKIYLTYDKERQIELAQRAIRFYDYRVIGRKLADDIEAMRRGYNNDRA